MDTTPVAQLIHRDHGGWLAVSGPGSPIRIAVVGETEAAAREAFAAEAAAWDRLAQKATKRASATRR